MRFRTEIGLSDHAGLIDHSTPIMLLGSCFSDNIGSRLRSNLFYVMTNPFGTVYNPLSIEAEVKRIASGKDFEKTDIVTSGNMHHCMLCHSALSSTDRKAMLVKINDRLLSAADFLRRSRILIITLGTAYVYTYIPTGEVVANCHKLPATMFTRRRIGVEECAGSLLRTIDSATQISPDIKIILTVSPIRHLSDGFHENQLSKSTLLLGIMKTIEMVRERAIYFPSYEIMLDDLRDYRFYAPDMCHPSETASDYIYECFGRSFFTESTQALCESCLKLYRRISHRPLTDDMEAIARFRNETERIASELLQRNPFLTQAYKNENITTI